MSREFYRNLLSFPDEQGGFVLECTLYPSSKRNFCKVLGVNALSMVLLAFS